MNLSLDIGRTLGTVVIGVVILALAAWLFNVDEGGPAQGFFALGEAVVVGGLGIAVGEKSGGERALRTLPE